MILTAEDLLDLFTDLFEGFLFVGTLTLIFEPKYSKKTTTIAYISFSFLIFLILVLTTFHQNDTMEIKPYKFAVDYILYTLSFFFYCITFFKDNILIMLIMPLSLLVINGCSALIALIPIYFIFVVIYQQPIMLIETNGMFKLVIILLSHFLDLLIFYALVKKAAKKKYIINCTDVISFIIIPIMFIVLITSCISVITIKDNDVELLSIILIIILITIAIAIIYSVMFSRISKDNQLRTEYLLTKQKMNLYEESVIKSGKQIEKMSKIKHDMKNYLLSIGSLISNKNYAEAQKLCTEMSENLQSVSVPINTKNILLNAIINIELDKAEGENIKFEVRISDCLSEFSGNSEIISVIGKICDNAIAYLKTQPREYRIMSLEILNTNDTVIIVCKNKITKTMTENNIDKKILIDICKKYNGNILYKEDNGYYIVKILLNKINN